MIKVKVFAKVNISLNITGIKNGYHMLDSVVASADIADVISLENSERDEVMLSSKNDSIENKILALARAMRNDYGFGYVRIKVENNIPLGAGLGASSADIAGVIVGIDELFNLGLDEQTRVRYADTMGSDVAFMLRGGCGKIVGRARVEDRFCMKDKDAIIAVKGFCNTSDVFKLYDKTSSNSVKVDDDLLITALQRGESIVGKTANVLTHASASINPNVYKAIEILGDGAYMSGSGSSVFAFDNSAIKKERLKKAGFKVFTCKIGNFETQVIKE